MTNTASLSFLLLSVVGACGSSSPESREMWSVGTYIGGGSIFGADSCTYEGGPAVFMPSGTTHTPSSTPAKGPRFVAASGRIIQRCGDQTSRLEAVEPTGVVIDGPAKIKAGSTSESYSAQLIASGVRLRGEASIDWQLGQDCDGLVTFGPVLGAQDTGGRDRTRTLVTTGKKGSCTLIAGLTTGSALYASYQPKGFQTERLITVE